MNHKKTKNQGNVSFNETSLNRTIFNQENQSHLFDKCVQIFCKSYLNHKLCNSINNISVKEVCLFSLYKTLV